MKKFLLLLSVIFAFGLTTVAMDAEAAKRMGSGKSMGTQRQAAPNKAPEKASTAAPAAGAAAAAPSRSWMGPLAGLAAGLGLAALASHLGFGEELATMMMFGLLAVAVMVAIGFFMRRRAAQQGARSGAGGMNYASVDSGATNGTNFQTSAYKAATPRAGGSMIGSTIGAGSPAVAANFIPADFDVAGFERNAKVNFIRLQAANDAGDLDDIRQFTTPEMFAELKMELTERKTTQKTDVASVHAQVTAVEEEAEKYVVSVRFTGVIKTEAGEPDESFDEIWHMSKSRQGQTGWVLCGIQQME